MSKSDAEESLAWMLKVNEIGYQREHGFYAPRKWRFDFVIKPLSLMVAVEIEGGAFTGGHRRFAEADKDCEKHNTAMRLGWKVLRFTPAMVQDGRALYEIERNIGRA